MPGFVTTAITLIFVFLLVSLIVTSINEIVARLFRLRARMLWRGIKVIIDDPALRQRFYGNGLIVNAKRAAAAGPVPDNDTNHPSYIAPRNFARAVTMAVGLEPASSETGAPKVTIAAVEASIAKMANAKIRDVLISALSDAKEDLAQFEKSLEDWYKTATDRLSGEFKRKNQTLSFIVGLAIAVALNVDALSLAMNEGIDQATQSSIVESAVKLAADDSATDLCNLSSAAPSNPPDDAQTLTKIECLVQGLGPLLEQLSDAAIGWPDPGGKAFLEHWAKDEKTGEDWITILRYAGGKLLGWLATGFAVTLGAPFWFDLLKRFVNIRATGVKPEEKPASA